MLTLRTRPVTSRRVNSVRPRLTASLLAALLIFNPLLTRAPSHAAEESPTFTPPWTQEKVIPKEVKDKEKEKPLASCTQTRKDGTIETNVTYADGTEIRYRDIPLGGITVPDPVTYTEWVITIPGPKGKTKITYNSRDKTRIVEEPGKQPDKQDWKEAMNAPLMPCGGTCNPPAAPGSNPPKKGSWLLPSDSRLARVAYQTYSPIPPASREIPADFPPSPLQLAATGDQPTSPTSQSQGKVVIINLKIVTKGDPPATTIALFDPGSQTTPEQFLDTPTPVTWDPKTDGEGPKTTRPGPTGIPVTEIPGGGIYIGWGWTSGRVARSTIEACAGEVSVEDEGLPLPPVPEFIRKRAEALKKADEQAKTLEKQADELDKQANKSATEAKEILDGFDPDYLDDLSKQYLTLDEAGRGEQLDDLIDADKLLNEAKEAREKAGQLRSQARESRDQAERNYGLPQKGASGK